MCVASSQSLAVAIKRPVHSSRRQCGERVGDAGTAQSASIPAAIPTKMLSSAKSSLGACHHPSHRLYTLGAAESMVAGWLAGLPR